MAPQTLSSQSIPQTSYCRARRVETAKDMVSWHSNEYNRHHDWNKELSYSWRRVKGRCKGVNLEVYWCACLRTDYADDAMD